jgi:hypothetical protein
VIRIETNTLKEILSKVGKCASNDKTAPMTQLMHIYANEHSIQFTTTNQVDTCVYTYIPGDTSVVFPDFDVTVMVDQFIKLVSKFTSAYTEFGLSDSGNEIIIVGNGSYKLALPLEHGKPIVYPTLKVDFEPASEVYTGPVYSIVSAAKSTEGAITKITPDVRPEDYPRTNYFFNETGCVTLDGFKASWLRDETLLQFDTLIYPSTIKMLSVIDSIGRDIEAYKSASGHLIFRNSVVTLISKEANGCEVFPYEVATSLIDSPMEAAVKVAPGHFLAALDRLKLFISVEDDSCVKLEFTDKGLFAYNCAKSCSEQISAECLEPFECYIDIDSLVAQLKSFDTDEPITLGFGNDEFIQLSGDGLDQIVVLSELD